MCHVDTEDRIIYSTACHPSLPLIAVSQVNNCALYRLEITEKKELSGVKLLQTFQTDFKGDDSVQVSFTFMM